MLQYITKRLLFTFPVLAAVSAIVFSAVRLVPGDVCRIVLATTDVDQRQCKAIRAELGLDGPVVSQDLRSTGGVVKGDSAPPCWSSASAWR